MIHVFVKLIAALFYWNFLRVSFYFTFETFFSVWRLLDYPIPRVHWAHFIDVNGQGLGPPKAITATGHKRARIFYTMLKNGVASSTKDSTITKNNIVIVAPKN